MSYRSDLLDICVTLVHETPRAILVDHGGKEHAWLPKSAIEYERNDDGTYTVTLPARLAVEKEIV